jgi:hypothetical protein
MNTIKSKGTRLMISILLALPLLLLLSVLLTAAGQEGSDPALRPIAVEVTSVAETDLVSGRYVGTVAISTPVSLGVLDLAFHITDIDGTLSGAVDVTRTLVYAGAPLLQGSITSDPDAITPTFRIDSQVFDRVVSGRDVARSFALVGEAQSDGDVLQGQYTETIEGFTPAPLLVTGIFLVVRPSRTLTESVPPGPPPPGKDHFIYLPVVLK